MYLLNCLLLCALLAFLYGFFPVSLNTSTFPNDPPEVIGNTSVNPEQLYKSRFDKTVLVVIDALRWDFVTPQLMPLTTSVMNHRGCLSKVLVESPTVTLPRIKALTTGSVPQYADMVRNLASSEVLKDSWLHSAKKRGLKTVFYGDNTWEKLFLGFFERSEGTTSFFVWDFTEVDNNVTRNVELELKRSDWDIMVLHYLGLDHIGHVMGPFSPRMPLKLQEMDGIIYKIVKATSSGLVLVTGDHGMRDAGGHGGTSHSEVTVPLVTVGLDCKNSTFLQTDIPANLAVLLGLDIPSSSIGQLQRDFLNPLSTTEYLYALRYNTETLIKKADCTLYQSDFFEATQLHEKYLSKGENGTETQHLYENCSQLINRHLYESTTKQRLPLLLLAVLSLANILIVLVSELTEAPRVHWGLCGFIGLTGVLLFLWSEFLCWTVLTTFLLKNITTLMKSILLKDNFSNLNTAEGFLVAAALLHPITFISTSYIEEEHYYWIFASVTLVVIKILQIVGRQAPQFKVQFSTLGNISVNLSVVKLVLVLQAIRFSIDLNSTVETSTQNVNNWANILTAEGYYLFHQAFFILGLVMTFFICPSRQKYLTLATLSGVFVLKSLSYHSAALGKLLWVLISAQLFCNRPDGWILSSVLLIKPHNVILIPLAVYTAKTLLPLFKGSGAFLALASYMLSNAFYFMQGHRNSLATVDVSIGYTGLNSYQPVIVIIQVLMHTYAFPVLFHLMALQYANLTKKQFWTALLTLRTSVVLLTSIVTLAFRHHLFVWSVFAPKLMIESVHTTFLFIEITIWYLRQYI